MADLAVISDVETLFRPLADDELALGDRLIRMASARLRAKVANLDLRIATGDLDPLTVTDVVASMVVRVLRNPEGVTQETIGPMGATFSAQVAPGFLMVTPDELELLVPIKAVRAAVGTIKVDHGMNRGFERSHIPLLPPL
jgi:hypothetical protein